MVAAGLEPDSDIILGKARFKEAVAADTTGVFSDLDFDDDGYHVVGLTYVGTSYTVTISQEGTDYVSN